MRRLQHARNKQDRAAQAALLVAAASVPNTLQKTLMARGTTDQGVVTGITMSVNYSIVATISKAIEETADQLAGTQSAANNDYEAHKRQRQFALLLNVLAAGGGWVAQKKLKEDAQESELRGMVRTGATWAMYAGVAGATVSLLQEAVEAVTKPKDKNGKAKVTRFPVGVIGGALFAGVMEYRRRQSQKNAKEAKTSSGVNTIEASAMGFGLLGALGGISYGQKKVADVLSGEMGKILPGSEDFWWSTGHVTAIFGTGIGIASLMHKVYHRIEEVATKIEPAYLEAPSSALVSSGPGSYVSWESLSVQGRRFVSSATTKQQIKTVMGSSARAEPIRVFIGLDSEPTEEQRVELAMKELERTKAFDRGLIMLVSPTGTGYVNYAAVESAELMSKGNIASVALQYSKRPSPLSLDRVPEGRKQLRMLIKALSARIAQLPAQRRPKLVLFGESLGAWTSQDAFVEQGTNGLVYASIDRALWIGSPYGSKWKTEVLGPPRPDVDPELVGSFDNISELEKLKPTQKQKLRFVMVTHYNDAVALFGARLLYQKPAWLGDQTERPPTVSMSQYYTSPGTFLLTLIDMKNAMNVIPGQFEASGHDYRADLAEFVRAAYGLRATQVQMQRIEKALRANELERAERLKPKEEPDS